MYCQMTFLARVGWQVAAVMSLFACKADRLPQSATSSSEPTVVAEAFDPEIEAGRRFIRSARPPLEEVAPVPPSPAAVPDLTKFELLAAAPLPPSPLPPYSIRDYAAEVEAALGTFATFDVFQAGTVIPITRDDVEPAAGEHTATDVCDRPVWLGLGTDGQCVPYSRVGILPGTKPQVVWVFIARRYKIRTDPAEKLFEDVAVIGHHRLTGDTAFFQMLDRSGKDGRRVPSPWEPADATPPGQLTADDFWLSPADTAGINCHQCHDSDPFIHSPYLRQVTVATPAGTRTLVPPIRQGPYRFVGSRFFTAWPAPRHFKLQNNACVQCHRMGTQRSSDTFLRWSTGTSRGWTTSSYDHYPQSHWMPLHEAEALTEADWEAKFRPDIQQLASCSADPTQPACRVSGLP